MQIGPISLRWRGKGALSQNSSRPELRLDPTPTGEEEARDFNDPPKARGIYNKDAAKTRVDRIARHLAVAWTVILTYLIFAQGQPSGVYINIHGVVLHSAPPFHLQPSEFIAVVTTTTISVFGFLVIVANHLFKR